MKRVIEATELPSGAYLITDARWPRNDLFTQDKYAMHIDMRLRAEFRNQHTRSGVLGFSPYVTLSSVV